MHKTYATPSRAGVRPATPPSRHCRKAHSSRLLAAIVLAGLAGCANMPSQIAQPQISEPDQQARTAKLKAKYSVDGKTVIHGQSFSGASAILPFETNLVGVQTQIMAMRGAYADRQASLLKQIDAASNIQFGGILLAAAGVAAGEIGLRNTGAGAAGLSTLWTSHYQLVVQAANYGLAAQAMSCLYKEISGVAPSFWTSAYDEEGVFQIAKANLNLAGGTPADAAAAYDALSGMYSTLHDSVEKIDQKLRSLQADVTIAKVSVSDIQEAAAFQGQAGKTGEAIDNQKTAKAATADVVTAAGEAGKAAAAANASQAKAKTAKESADRAALKTNAAKTKQRDAWQRRIEWSSEAQALEINIKRLPSGDKSRRSQQARLDELNDQLKAVQLEIDKFDGEVDGLEKAQATAEAAAAALAEQAAHDEAIANAKKKIADQKAIWADLVSSGVAGRATQLPAKANACVVAMGK